MIDLHTFIGGWITGLATGAGLMRWRSRSSTPHRESQPTFAELLMPLPRDRDPDWRRSINHENTNAPSGPPPLLMLKSPTVTVKGLNWPATVGDFTLVGRADNEGAWRWYERRTGRGVERVRLDHQLRPMGLPHRP